MSSMLLTYLLCIVHISYFREAKKEAVALGLIQVPGCYVMYG